jgi:sortase A
VIVWFAWAYWSSARFQSQQAQRLENLQQAPVEKTLAREGDPFGEISIPRLGLSAIVAEGVDESTLRHAVGHFPESSTPEAAGTVALAGHRDTFFRPLANVRLHDLVQLKTPQGKYEYEVVHTAIVGPEHVEVVQSSPQSDLTLVTCYPFRYVGQAPLRFIVQAIRIPSRVADNR